jgi:hypothetical protein
VIVQRAASTNSPSVGSKSLRHLCCGRDQRYRQRLDLPVLPLLGQANDIQVSGRPVDQSKEEQAAAADNHDVVRRASPLEDGAQ